MDSILVFRRVFCAKRNVFCPSSNDWQSASEGANQQAVIRMIVVAITLRPVKAEGRLFVERNAFIGHSSV
jgi:hypothetical protein